MRKKLEGYLAIFCAFVVGALLAGFILVRYHTMALLEQVYIRSNAMEAYKAVATLELIRQKKVENAVDFLEWQADDGLMGLSEYIKNPRKQKKLDNFALQTIAKSKEYRERYPRQTSSKSTDSTIKCVLNTDTTKKKPLFLEDLKKTGPAPN